MLAEGIARTGTSQCDPSQEMATNYHYLFHWPTVSVAEISLIVEDWYSGLDFYNSATGTYIEEHYRDFAWDYKRLMWASSYEIGCGMSRCDFGDHFLQPQGMLDCYYNPGGNFTSSQKPYRQGTPCSQCNQHPGSWLCENNLCVAQ